MKRCVQPEKWDNTGLSASTIVGTAGPVLGTNRSNSKYVVCPHHGTAVLKGLLPQWVLPQCPEAPLATKYFVQKVVRTAVVDVVVLIL